MKRFLGLLTVIGLAGFFPAPPAQALSANIDVHEYAFNPSTDTLPALGTGVTWTNSGNVSHTATQDAPLNMWDTGTIAPSATSGTVFANEAGSFPYHCSFHPSLMHGVLKVPMDVTPTSGSTSTVFTINPGDESPAAGRQYHVEARRNRDRWKTLHTGTDMTFTHTFHKPGRYKLRSRVEVISTGDHSGWSPQSTIHVS